MSKKSFLKYFGFMLLAPIMLTSCHKSLEDKAYEEAKQMTQKQCPTPFTNNVRLDSVTFDKKTRVFTYYCSMNGILDDAKVISRNKKIIMDAYEKNVLFNPSTKVYRQEHIHFKYIFRSYKNSNNTLLQFEI